MNESADAVATHCQDPIGVFDSGIGGLTVLKALIEKLPGETFLYLGDTAKVPYGNKSKETVTRYALANTLFLLQKGVKAIVVACNTVSSTCLSELARHFRAPVIGVIEPAAQEAVRRSRNGRIGVIGTAGTVASGAYDRALLELLPQARIWSAACPLFVPLAEEGFAEHPATALVVKEYVRPIKESDVDTLILACTHYPLLKRAISDYMGPDVQLVDSGPATAALLEKILVAGDCRKDPHSPSEIRYYLTDRQPLFRQIGERFLDRAIDHVEIVSIS